MLALTLLAIVAAQEPPNPGVVDTFTLPMWGERDDSMKFLRLGARIDIWSIACEAPPAPPVDVDGNALDVPEAPIKCFPAKLRLPMSTPAMSGEFTSAREELARMDRCFDTRVAKAPNDVVAAAVLQDMEPVSSKLMRKTPTLLLVAWEHKDGWESSFELFAQSANGEGWAQLAIPPKTPVSEVSLTILEAPGAAAMAKAARGKRFEAAVKRARGAYASSRGQDRARARANLAVVALLANDPSAVPVLDDAELGEDAAEPQVTETLELVRRWVNGEMWLGHDPCRR